MKTTNSLRTGRVTRSLSSSCIAPSKRRRTSHYAPSWMGIGLSLALVSCGLPDDQFRVAGTVQVFNPGVGELCWFVRDDAGHTYEPTNLPPGFEVDQLHVAMIVTLNKTLASYCTVGELVDIVSIDKQQSTRSSRFADRT